MTLLIKPIDLPGVKIVQKKIRENPTSVDPPPTARKFRHGFPLYEKNNFVVEPCMIA